jgi:hypothetical protein
MGFRGTTVERQTRGEPKTQLIISLTYWRPVPTKTAGN